MEAYELQGGWFPQVLVVRKYNSLVVGTEFGALQASKRGIIR